MALPSKTPADAGADAAHGCPPFALVVPTRNAGLSWPEFLAGLDGQTVQPSRLLIIDSGSTDATVALARQAGWEVVAINPGDFDHGGTRQRAVEMLAECDPIVFATQDIRFADEGALASLLAAFADPKIGAAFGRQLPNPAGNALERHPRLFNYPGQSRVKSWDDRKALGIKAAFISNAFAAYRRPALATIGGFPRHCIVSEDTFVAARMLAAGWHIAYCAQARVYHSHGYNWRQEFQRYFDIGVFHARESWLRREFGAAEGEGCRYLVAEAKYLRQHDPHLLISFVIRAIIKYVGFRAGLAEKYLPSGLKRRLSMQKAFWLQEGRGSDAARTVEAD